MGVMKRGLEAVEVKTRECDREELNKIRRWRRGGQMGLLGIGKEGFLCKHGVTAPSSCRSLT